MLGNSKTRIPHGVARPTPHKLKAHKPKELSMSHRNAMLESFAADLAADNQFHLPICVGDGRDQMRSWEFDELQEIVRELYPDAPPLKKIQATQRQ